MVPKMLESIIEQWRVRHDPIFRGRGGPGALSIKVTQDLGLKCGLLPGRCTVVSQVLVRSVGK